MYARKRSIVLTLASLLCALSALSQSGGVSIDDANRQSEDMTRLVRDQQSLALPTLSPFEFFAHHAVTTQPWDGSFSPSEYSAQPDAPLDESPAMPENKPAGQILKLQPTTQRLRNKPADFNREIYYRNKLEFSLDGGWLPINIPFPLDIFIGDNYNTYPLKYTLVPIIASLRWHLDSVGSPWILRGNWDLTFSASATAIPRGPETHYFSYDMGIRRNFVQRNWRAAPYFDVRLGVGRTDAKGPLGVPYAQGQDITFTVNMGSGVRYNFNPRYAISAGLNFMHISNLDLSESNGKPNWGVRNYGINVYGPMVGLDIQLRRHSRQSAK